MSTFGSHTELALLSRFKEAMNAKEAKPKKSTKKSPTKRKPIKRPY